MTDTSTEAVDRLCRDIHDGITCGEILPVDGVIIQDTLRALAADRDALKAEVERLREALIPFSEEAGWWFEKNYNASDKVVESFEDYYGFMTCGDLFRARAALQENTDATRD